MLGADLEDIGAVLGEALAAGRTGQHAREVEHADAGERSFRRPWLFRRRIADARDLDQRLCSHGLGLRVTLPVFRAAHEAGTAPAGLDRVLQRPPGPGARLFPPP